MAAQAHSLDQYLQASYVTLTPTTIELEVDLTPGVLVAAEAIASLDLDGDGVIDDAEASTYAAAIIDGIDLRVDDAPIELVVDGIQVPSMLVLQAGSGTIVVSARGTLPDDLEGTHRVTLENRNTATGITYQANAFVARGADITLGPQERSSDQQRLAVDATFVGTSAGTSDGAATTVTTTTDSGPLGTLLSTISEPTASPLSLLFAVVLAMALGGLHALTPGHGKALVAAYLVGSRGTVRHALALGGIVTFTHTSSVLAVGVVALAASDLIVPGVLTPVLELLAGLLVVALGVRLVAQRWAGVRVGEDGSHAHGPDGHMHGPDAHTHESGGRTHGPGGHTHDPIGHPYGADGHTHEPGVEDAGSGGHVHHHHETTPSGRGDADPLGRRGLLSMGVAAGLLPCPEALGIMIVAIGLGRIALGLGLIVAFSLGVALVLMAIGVLLVRSRSRLERLGGLGGRFGRYVPLTSAVVVTVLGVGIMLGGTISVLRA